MHPIVAIIDLVDPPRPIGGYGLAVAIGVALTGLLVARAAHRAGDDVGAVLAAIGYTIGGSFAGAFGLFVLVEWARTGSFVDAITHGGLVFYGAVPTGVLASWLAARGLRVRWLKTVDLAIPAIAAGHAIGRIGCFLGGCCYGAPWDGPLAVTFTHPLAPAAHPPVPRHPVQLYESFGLLVLAIAFALTPIGRAGSGRRALAYVGAYAVLRFSVETLRGDEIRGVVMGLLSTSQLISLAALGIVAVVALGMRRADQRAQRAGA